MFGLLLNADQMPEEVPFKVEMSEEILRQLNGSYSNFAQLEQKVTKMPTKQELLDTQFPITTDERKIRRELKTRLLYYTNILAIQRSIDKQIFFLTAYKGEYDGFRMGNLTIN
jgi:hypothetical protein